MKVGVQSFAGDIRIKLFVSAVDDPGPLFTIRVFAAQTLIGPKLLCLGANSIRHDCSHNSNISNNIVRDHLATLLALHHATRNVSKLSPFRHLLISTANLKTPAPHELLQRKLLSPPKTPRQPSSSVPLRAPL